MFLRLLLLAALFAPLLLPGRAASNTAQLSFHCQSVRLYPASVKQLGLTYRISFTTVDGEPNGELGIDDDPNSPTIHSTVILFEHPVLGDTLINKLFLDPPDIGDADINRVDDFFQVDRAVNGVTTAGAFEDPFFGLVEVTATWSRAAGSTTGNCVMTLQGDFVDATFNVPFEVFQYRGPVTYGPGLGAPARVDLTRQGAPGSLQGDWHLSLHSPDELTFPADQWLDEGGHTFTFIPAGNIEFYLTHIIRQFYHGLGGTFDGMPATPADEEYIVWEFNLFDPNDADGDRIPDLTDPPGPSSVAPVVTVRIEDSFLKLRVTAEIGQTVIIERKPTLGTAEWSEVETTALSQTTQEFTLPLSGDDSDFYRARTP